MILLGGGGEKVCTDGDKVAEGGGIHTPWLVFDELCTL